MKPKAKQKQDPRIEEVYEQEVTFHCPKRGLVKQKVKIKKYKTVVEADPKHTIKPENDVIEKLENEDDGLQIYNEDEPVQE